MLISPESIRPYPKFQKSVTKRKREVGKSRILTETPEKDRLEEKAMKKDGKKYLFKDKVVENQNQNGIKK